MRLGAGAVGDQDGLRRIATPGIDPRQVSGLAKGLRHRKCFVVERILDHGDLTQPRFGHDARKAGCAGNAGATSQHGAAVQLDAGGDALA